MTKFQKYIQRYLEASPSKDLIVALQQSNVETLDIYKNLTEDQGNFAYDEDKWTLKELLQHLIDAERIFVYRALRFARKDKTELAGWDENLYAKSYDLSLISLRSLIDEFEYTRKSTILFFENLRASAWKETGVANGNEVSVETLGQLTAGHNAHHLDVIRERYISRLN